MAEYYSAELSQKIRRGMDINAEKCLSNGSNPGLGYTVDKDRQFHINTETAPLSVKSLKCTQADRLLQRLLPARKRCKDLWAKV